MHKALVIPICVLLFCVSGRAADMEERLVSLQKGKGRFLSGDYNQAMVCFSAVVNERKDDALAMQAYFWMDQIAFSHNLPALVNSSLEHAKNRDEDRAVNMLNRFLGEYPFSAPAHAALSDVYSWYVLTYENREGIPYARKWEAMLAREYAQTPREKAWVEHFLRSRGLSPLERVLGYDHMTMVMPARYEENMSIGAKRVYREFRRRQIRVMMREGTCKLGRCPTIFWRYVDSQKILSPDLPPATPRATME